MQRRSFCKIAALALGSIALSSTGMKASTISSPGSFRVTVMKRECYLDLQSLYLDEPDAGPCDEFVTGETFEFLTPTAACPEGFCPKAWSAILQAASSLEACPKSGAEDGRVALVSCPDGTRPVIFKIEQIL